jgi:anti-sigma regulatory factor (Ser/Thr protein kinase)
MLSRVRSIQVPRSFGPREAPAWFDVWAGCRDEQELRILLPAGAFLAPTGVALLAAGIADRQASKLTTLLRAEEPQGDCVRYLQRIDFFSQLGVEREEDFATRESAGPSVPLRRIVDLRVARKLADETADFLETQLGGPTWSSLLRAARLVFEELGANVVQHSGRPETGFGVAQAFAGSGRLEIAFADAGIGFLASLGKNPEFTGRLRDDAEAVQLALSKQVTRGGRSNLGWGLDLLGRFVDRIGGELWIASGDALLHRRDAIPPARANTLQPITAWRGAWLCIDALL